MNHAPKHSLGNNQSFKYVEQLKTGQEGCCHTLGKKDRDKEEPQYHSSSKL